jgi:3-oxoacyl-[acyl-carrier protein] reductase
LGDRARWRPSIATWRSSLAARRRVAPRAKPGGRRTHAAIVADVTVAADVERMVSEAASQLGRIDILVNNAGGSFPDDDAGWENAFHANIEAAVRATRAVVPHMRVQGGGAIVHIASIWGREAGGGRATR